MASSIATSSRYGQRQKTISFSLPWFTSLIMATIMMVVLSMMIAPAPTEAQSSSSSSSSLTSIIDLVGYGGSRSWRRLIQAVTT
jgi:hypothetical protein